MLVLAFVLTALGVLAGAATFSTTVSERVVVAVGKVRPAAVERLDSHGRALKFAYLLLAVAAFAAAWSLLASSTLAAVPGGCLIAVLFVAIWDKDITG